MQGRAVTATRWKVDHEANPLCRPRQSGTSLSEPTTTRDTPIRGKRRYHLPASESHVLHPKNYPLLEPEGQCQGCTTTTTRGPKSRKTAQQAAQVGGTYNWYMQKGTGYPSNAYVPHNLISVTYTLQLCDIPIPSQPKVRKEDAQRTA